MTTFSTTVAVAVLAAAWAVASPAQVTCALAESPANISAAPDQSALFVSAINQLRASKGLNPLAVDGQLTGVAQDWAQHMAEADGISHRLDLRAGISGLWRRLGENVGFGPTVTELMNAFIASPGHYQNLVDPSFTHLGVGTVRTTSGLLYTAHEFMTLESSGPAVIAAPAAPASTPAPRVTTPRVRTTTPPVAAAVPAAPVVTAPPTTVAPAPPTALPTTVELLPADKQLQSSGKQNQQKQQSKRNGRCRSHAQNLQAIVL